jgi:hypothetical protein
MAHYKPRDLGRRCRIAVALEVQILAGTVEHSRAPHRPRAELAHFRSSVEKQRQRRHGLPPAHPL